MRRIFSWKVLGIVVLILLSLASGASAYYFYRQYQTVKRNPDVLAKQEAAYLKEKVAQLMVLPAGEPNVATVLDKDKLKDQAFFKNAENGDKILIYLDAKKAILYRPSSDKIIEVAPLAAEEEQK